MKKRIVLFAFSMLLAVTAIGWIFWEQEAKYFLPTPIPGNFKDVEMGQYVALEKFGIPAGKFTMLHFYNPDCPCSRFNMMEFERISKKYKEQTDVYVIIQSTDERAAKRFSNKYDLDLPIILDKNGSISDLCGIYSTPQSVLLDKGSNIYFKGNYNVARYCSRKETSFADLAMGHLLKGEELPLWILTELTLPYGCSLPSDDARAPFEIASFLNKLNY
jgi:AhpC/TSA family